MAGQAPSDRSERVSFPRLTATIRDIRKLLFGSRIRTVFAAWLFIILALLMRNLLLGSSHDRVVAISLFVCASCTVIVWAFRAPLSASIKKWRAPARTKFIIIGGLGAAWVEYVFWQFERVFGITGVAASPNLAVDLLVTMPWYLLMIALFWRVQTRIGLGFPAIFVLGGIYELGADGTVGPLIGGTFTPSSIPVGIALIPMFCLAYSFMVIPCSAILKDDIDAARAASPGTGINRYLYSLLPLLGLMPYLAIAFIMMAA